MKHFNIKTRVMSTALVAGALCSSLLAGCGSSTAQVAPSTQEAPAQAGVAAVADVASDEINAYGYTNLTSFSAQTMDGKTFTNEDLAKADVTIINFWGSYCGFCIEEMPHIAQWEKALPSNVQVITVCTDYDSDPESAKDFLREAGFAGTTLVAGTGDFERLSDEVMYLPTTLAVDSSGRIVGVYDGYAKDVPSAFGGLVNDALAAQGKSAAHV